MTRQAASPEPANPAQARAHRVIRSVLGQGSTFSFSLTLPVASLESVKAADVSGSATLNGSAGRLRGARVLLVEDNVLNRRLAAELLREAGIVVDMAEDGQKAVSAIQQERYDSILMDMQMPVMDGLEATRAIRQMPGLDRLPIIAMTANAMQQDREACVTAGMNDFLSKPIDSMQLLVMLDKWITP